MNKGTKITLFIVIALIIAGMASYQTIKNKLKKEETPKDIVRPGLFGGKGAPLNVNAKVIKPETLLDVIKASKARVIPDEEVELSFESSGKVTDIFFKEGTDVKKGDLLAKINDKPLQAELQKLETQVPLAEDRVFRQKSLLEKDAVSKEAYEQVSTELEKLKADIALVKSRIAQTELRAPFDGVIGLRNVSEGAYVSPTTIVSILTKVIPLKVDFSVNEKQSDIVSPGTRITFRLPPDLTEYGATIYAVESRVDENTFALKVRAIYPNGNGKMRPGRSADITIRANEIKNAIVIPNESVIAEMGNDIAYVYSGGKAKKVELEKGIRTESDMQILKGLNPGDTLIISGVMQLRDGLPVTIDNIK
jgi:membrane fusion protein (multidrug efflux system)